MWNLGIWLFTKNNPDVKIVVGDMMNNKGFVASALLYGILSLFLVLIIGTFSILINRKLASDRLKESALMDVQDLKTDESCFKLNVKCEISGYDSNCGNVVFIDEKNIDRCKLTGIAANAFSGFSNGYVYIKSELEIDDNAFSGGNNITFITAGFDSKINNSENIWGASNSRLKVY